MRSENCGESPTNTNKRRQAVLVVINDRRSRTHLLKTLRANGYFPVEAEDGNMALRLAGNSSFDLLSAIVDLNLDSGPGGLEVVTRLRREGGTPVVMLVASDSRSQTPEISAIAEELGFYVITRPLNMSAILAELSEFD